MNTIRKLVLSPYALFIIATLTLPLLIRDPFWLNRLSLYLVFGLLSLSVSLCWGYCGILSLGHSVFFGLGAYCVAMSLKLSSPDSLTQGVPFPLPDFMVWNTPSGQELQLPWLWIPFQSFWVALAAAFIVPALVASILGWFMFYGGVSGVFTSIITLSMVVILNLVMIDQQPITNGFNGLTNLAVAQVGAIVFDPYSLNTYLLCALTLGGALLGLWWLTNTKTGLIFKAIKAGEQRVEYFGYDIASYKIFIFSTSAMIAGIAGVLFVICSQYASPTIMDVNTSILAVIWAAVGGRESLIGAVLGGIVINWIQNLLSESEQLLQVWKLIIGIIFVAVVMFLPEGLAGLIMALIHNYRQPQLPKPDLQSVSEPMLSEQPKSSLRS